MDPGTALSIVSLVYDVTKDLYEYYRSWRDCDDDIVELRQQLLGVHRMFRVLRETLRQSEMDTGNQLVYDAIGHCNDVATELRGKLEKFPSKDSLPGIWSKVLAQGRKVFYPFRKSTIVGLEEDLETCRDELQGAVGVVILGTTLDLSQRLKTLDARLVDSSEKFENAMQSLFMNTVAVNGIRNTLETDQQRRAMSVILEWLCPVDYSQQQNDSYAERSGSTGEWMFASPKFTEWVQDPSRILFCPGDPGVGKTIMAATVIRHLLEADDITAEATIYVYFNYKRKGQQDVMHVLRALLRQLVYAKGVVPEALRILYDHCSRRQTQPTQQEIEKELSSVMSSFPKMNIVLDALDECQEHMRENVIKAIKRLHKLDHVHALITSRPLPDIRSSIESHFENAIHLEIRASDSDLTLYLEEQLSQCSNALANSLRFRDSIVTTIVNKVKGIFLLAQLFVAFFRELKKPQAVKDALEGLKTQSNIETDMYNSAYDGAIQRIEGQSRESCTLALEALAWIAYAQRPLKPIELEHAIAIKVDDSERKLNEDNIVQCDVIVSCCAGLITEDKQTGIIRLVHFTTQTYLEHKLAGLTYAPSPDPDSAISLKCLTYLSFNTLATGPCTTDAQCEERLNCHPFLDYAAKHWVVHVGHSEARHRMPKDIDCINATANLFLDSPELVKSAAQIMFYNRRWLGSWELTCTAHLLAMHGARELLGSILERGVNIDLRDQNGRTPLSWAAGNGHASVVELLLAREDVNVDSCDNNGQTPLSWAAKNSHAAVVELLLAREGINVNSCDRSDRTPLSWAAEKGHAEVVQLLLAREEVDVNSRISPYGNALFAASAYGNFGIVTLLIAGGLQYLAIQDDMLGRSRVHQAASYGYQTGIEEDVQAGFDINAIDNHQWTALHWAAYFGQAHVTKWLLRNGADSTKRDWHEWTAYDVAVFAGHSPYALCIERGATSVSDVVPGECLHGFCDSCCHVSFIPESVELDQVHCIQELIEYQYHCETCPPGYDLCFRCFQDVAAMHPGHEFTTKFRYP